MWKYAAPILIASALSFHCASSHGSPKEENGENSTILQKVVSLTGEIHGAVPEASIYVLTVRNPEDFFDSQQYSLYTFEPEVADVLSTLERHDQVVVKGLLRPNSAGQPHIQVQSIDIIERYEDGAELPPYEHETTIPADFPPNGQLIAKVHAIAGEGRIVVLEFGDAVVPMISTKPADTAALSRNDKIRVNYTLRQFPNRPPHLELAEDVDQPLEVLERIADGHGQLKSIEGKLVKFPKSPQITIDVYGILVEDADGIKRIYTLVNFQQPEVFSQILEKLAEVWDSHGETAVRGRNYLVNPNVTLQAQGTLNQVSKNQANPQLLLSSEEAITIR